MLLQFIEDRELWTWKLDGSRDFLAYLDTQPADFAVWHALAQMTPTSTGLADILAAGRLMNLKLDCVTAILAKDAEPVTLCGIKGHKRNAGTFFTNDLGHAIYSKNGSFAMIWCVETGLLYVSLRGNKDKLDVSTIARQFGGGGHAAAAAFRLPVASPEAAAFFAKYIAGPGEQVGEVDYSAEAALPRHGASPAVAAFFAEATTK